MKKLLLLLVLCVLSACGDLPSSFQRVSGGSIVHTQSNFVFPSNLYGFFGGVRLEEYAPDNVSNAYVYYGGGLPRLVYPQITATVYVYSQKYHSHGSQAILLERINSDVLSEISSVHGKLGNLKVEAAQFRFGNTTLQGIHDKFFTKDYTPFPSDNQLLGEVYVFVTGKWVLKFRFTNNISDTEKTRNFIQEFLDAQGTR